MIPCETSLKEISPQRYRRLAGPFTCHESGLWDHLVSFLRNTGARIALVAEPEGACVWRLRSECETYEETARRLERMHRVRPNQ